MTRGRELRLHVGKTCLFSPLSEVIFGKGPNRASSKNNDRNLGICPKSGELGCELRGIDTVKYTV